MPTYSIVFFFIENIFAIGIINFYTSVLTHNQHAFYISHLFYLFYLPISSTFLSVTSVFALTWQTKSIRNFYGYSQKWILKKSKTINVGKYRCLKRKYRPSDVILSVDFIKMLRNGLVYCFLYVNVHFLNAAVPRVLL